ncbi:MAG: hypothetical protein ACO1OC_10200 [Tuberibacillus sp.]
MKSIAWFVIGELCAYQAAFLFPGHDGFTTILSSFIMEPFNFLEGAIFIFASFLIFSYSIRYTLDTLFEIFFKKRRTAVIYGMISTIIVIMAWLLLFLKSPYISVVIISLTLIHLGLSMENLKREKYKEH